MAEERPSGERGAARSSTAAASATATGSATAVGSATGGAKARDAADAGANGTAGSTASEAARAAAPRRVIPGWAWMTLSIACAIALWIAASLRLPAVFASPALVAQALASRLADGTLVQNVAASLSRVLAGFALAFVASIPTAFLMAWYEPFCRIVEPWIQFVRNIPPLAYVFLIIAGLGIGQVSKIAVIFIAAFLIMVITMYQGVRSVDPTLIKAARVLGATQRDLFFKVTVPASTPFIFVSARLGLSTSLTTLMASEIVGGDRGIGVMIQQASGYYQMDVVLLGVILLGVIGIVFEQVVRLLERRLTGWQEQIR